MPRAILLVSLFVLMAADPRPSVEKQLFDFENEADLKAFVPLELEGAKTKEPAPRAELSSEHVSSGKQSLKITFAGGTWPTLISTRVPPVWDEFETFHADVTVTKPCLLGFQVMQEKSRRGGGYDGAVSRWAKTVLATPGTHHISAALHPNGWSAVRRKLEDGKDLGDVVSIEIFVYKPAPGETIWVDNIRLSSKKETTAPAKPKLFKVAGTDLEVEGVRDLGKKLAPGWKKPASVTREQVEDSFKKQLAELKKKHPGAVLAVFRAGAAGYDPAQPDKVFQGWQDAYWSSHGPDGMTLERTDNRGKSATHEVFMRHRSPLMRVDLSSVPNGAKILAAQLVLVRARPLADDRQGKPTMWAVEPCNRPWVENEVNAYEFARGKFWKAIGGQAYDGDDPDFWPVYLAHGPGGLDVSTWDFTEAVKFWTEGRHANHGFMLHGDSHDYMTAHTREAARVEDRPALLVIYEPMK